MAIGLHFMSIIMATSTPLTDVAPNLPVATSAVHGSTKASVTSLLIAMMVGAIIASMGFGGALYCLARSGRLSLRKGTISKSAYPAGIATHLVTLDPLLVNLADEGESTYVRLSITLQVEDADVAKESKATSNKNGDDVTATARDTALTVLGQQTANGLLAADGKEQLKAELLKALNQQTPSLKVKKILFTDFLVQR